MKNLIDDLILPLIVLTVSLFSKENNIINLCASGIGSLSMAYYKCVIKKEYPIAQGIGLAILTTLLTFFISSFFVSYFNVGVATMQEHGTYAMVGLVSSGFLPAINNFQIFLSSWIPKASEKILNKRFDIDKDSNSNSNSDSD